MATPVVVLDTVIAGLKSAQAQFSEAYSRSKAIPLLTSAVCWSAVVGLLGGTSSFCRCGAYQFCAVEVNCGSFFYLVGGWDSWEGSYNVDGLVLFDSHLSIVLCGCRGLTAPIILLHVKRIMESPSQVFVWITCVFLP